MLVNWEEHEMKLEGIKVADEGKSLFTNAELEMATLLPICSVNVCRELGRTTWSIAAEWGESDLRYQ